MPRSNPDSPVGSAAEPCTPNETPKRPKLILTRGTTIFAPHQAVRRDALRYPPEIHRSRGPGASSSG